MYHSYRMKQLIRLSAWAKANGVSRMTAWRLATRGEIPNASLSPVGHWFVEIDAPEDRRQTVAYARVSSHDQKADLDRQIARIAEWAAKEDVRIDRYEPPRVRRRPVSLSQAASATSCWAA